MKRFATLLKPQTITSQLLAILVIVLVIAQIANLFILIGERRLQAQANVLSAVMDEAIEQMQRIPPLLPTQRPFNLSNRSQSLGRFFLSENNHASIGQTATNINKRYQREFIKRLNDNNIQFQTVLLTLRKKPRHTRKHKPPHHSAQQRPRQVNKHHKPPPKHRRNAPGIATESSEQQEFVISVELPSGTWFNAIVVHQSIERLTPRILTATLILLTLTLLTAWFFIKRITRPISELTIAAERFGRGNATLILNEQGPQDIKQAAQAFNAMQRRLSKLLETQRTMLRAVGHDLRTPLTSLRLRSELLSDEAQRNKFIETIDDMTQMTEEMLNWAKNASGLEEKTAIDLPAFLSSIVDDFADQGHDIELEANPKMVIHIRRVALKRALQNIINNALKYGNQARISTATTQGYINIHIDDTGPGIDQSILNDALWFAPESSETFLSESCSIA